MDTPPDYLQLALQDALQTRLAESKSTESFQLLSYCYENALALHDALEERRISHKLVYGGLRTQLEGEGLELTPENAEAIGARHYWVEAEGYICEIATEDTAQDEMGTPVILSGLPEEYVRFSVVDEWA